MGGGGTDVNASLASSSSAQSGIGGNFSRIFGDKIAGGTKIPVWVPIAIIGAAFAFGIVWLVTRK